MNQHIILCSSSITVQKVVKWSLSGEGYKIHEAKDIDEAKVAIQKKDVDLLIIDQDLVKEGGDVFCKFVKSSKEHSEIPIIFLVRKGNSGNGKTGIEDCKVDRTLKVPFESNELENMVTALMGIDMSEGGEESEIGQGRNKNKKVSVDNYKKEDKIESGRGKKKDKIYQGKDLALSMESDIMEKLSPEMEYMDKEKLPSETKKKLTSDILDSDGKAFEKQGGGKEEGAGTSFGSDFKGQPDSQGIILSLDEKYVTKKESIAKGNKENVDKGKNIAHQRGNKEIDKASEEKKWVKEKKVWTPDTDSGQDDEHGIEIPGFNNALVIWVKGILRKEIQNIVEEMLPGLTKEIVQGHLGRMVDKETLASIQNKNKEFISKMMKDNAPQIIREVTKEIVPEITERVVKEEIRRITEGD